MKCLRFKGSTSESMLQFTCLTYRSQTSSGSSPSYIRSSDSKALEEHKATNSPLSFEKCLQKVFSRNSQYTIRMQCFKNHPYCLCWLMAEQSPSWSWLRPWCRADMALPRRSGWMFSLLSSHSTSPPSAIVEIKTTRWLQTDRNTHRHRCISYFFMFLSVLNHYSNLFLQLFSSTLVMVTEYT